MDYLPAWLTQHFASIYTCYDWYSITFHVVIVLITTTGLIGAVRRRDRSLVWLMAGLLLLFVADPVRNFGMMLFVRSPERYAAAFDYVQASRPWEVLRKVDRNLIQPVGLILAVAGAIALVRSDRVQAVKAGSETRDRDARIEPPTA